MRLHQGGFLVPLLVTLATSRHPDLTSGADFDRLATAALAFNGLSTDTPEQSGPVTYGDKGDESLLHTNIIGLASSGQKSSFSDDVIAHPDAEDNESSDLLSDDVSRTSATPTTELATSDASVSGTSSEAGLDPPEEMWTTEGVSEDSEIAELTSAASSHQHCPQQCICFDLTVDCANRELQELPAILPNWTQVLDLHDNLLEELPENLLASVPALRILNVNNNGRLTLQRSALAGLPHLHTINLSGCGLGEVPLLELPSSVRVVNLSGNNIRQMSRAALAAMRHLHELDLSHNRIARLPANMFPRDTQLRTLKLHSNRIGSLELGRLDNLGRLHTLKLSKNRVSRLYKDAFQGLTRLRELDLNRNRLQLIDSLVFSGMDSLQVLKLKRNSIERLMDGAFYHLPNMTQLFLDHNAIRNVTKGWLYGTRRLRQLSLSHNRLHLADRDCWNYCEQLARLDLRHNRLAAVDAHTFASLPRLTELLLDHNQVALIEENALQGSPKLKTLELNNNLISSTIEDRSGAFAGLSQLTRLGLRHNRIMSVGGQALAGAPHLQELDLAGNALTTIQRAAFEALTQLRVLVVDSEALLCDCTLRWLPGWLAEMGHVQTVTARCHHPARLHGRRLTDVPAQQLTCQDSPKPVIRLQPQTGKTLKGDNLTLSCEAESSANDTMQFGWRKDSQPVSPGRAVTLAWAHTDGRPGRVMRSELRVANLTDSDAGQYQCVVSNKFGVTYSEKATIAVHVFPVFTLRPVDVELRAGSTAKLECKALGQPPATIAWQKDGGSDFPAARERRMHMLQSEDVFFIVQVQPADQGTYTCTARNDAGQIRANATLSVLELPSFVRPMEAREVVAGDTAVLDCMASGSPAPHLSWSKDGAPLQPTERHFYTAGHQLLIIVQTQAQDAGQYECRLSNVLGEIRGRARLSVLPVSSLGLDDDSTYAIIIIAVVSGVVVTSLVWVIIIYQARKRSLRQLRARAAAAAGGSAGLDRQLPAAPVYAAPLRDQRASSAQLYTAAGDDGSEHSSGKDSGQGGHDELAGAECGLPLVVALAADSDDEGVGGTPLMERRPRVLTTFQSGGPSRAHAHSLQTVVPPHLYADRRLTQLADGALVTARARQPTEV